MAEKIYYNIDNRLFYLSDDIDNESIGTICFGLLSLIQSDDNRESKEKDFKREPIKIYIQSFGGSVYDMWALIDIILNSKTPIYTYCTGYAMSAGFKIFLAGHKRFCSKHSTFLYHQLSSITKGKYQDIVEETDELTRIQEEIEEYVCERTKIPASKLKEIKIKKLNWYFNYKEALKLGVATDLIESETN